MFSSFQSDFNEVQHTQTIVILKRWPARRTELFIWFATQALESCI